MLPIGILMALIGVRWLPNVTEAGSAHLDLLSVPLAALGFGGLVYGLSLAGGGQGIAVPLGIGVTATIAFLIRQGLLARHDKAMLDLRPFRSRPFTLAVSIMVASMAALFGVVILLPLYLLGALHLAPVDVGLLLLPGSLLMGFLGRPVGSWYDRLGPRPIVIPGVMVTSAAIWALASIGPETTRWYVMGCHIVLSLGLALVFTPVFTASMSAVPPPLYSHASAIIGSIQQVAGAAGTALAVTIMATVETAARAAGVSPEAAISAGVRAAFLGAAVLSLVPIVVSFFVVRQPAQPDAVPGGN
jgi:DHA2 family lincomycin resistance protein-like MFS transporter